MATRREVAEVPGQTREDFRLRLRAVLEKFEMTRSQLAVVCGVSESRVDQWLTGSVTGNFPRFPELILLQDHLTKAHKSAVSLDWFYQGKDINMDEALRRDLNRRVRANPFTR